MEKVSQQASLSARKRQNYNFHETLSANVQRMLNAMEPGTYVQPHKHEDPDKVEAFLILTGKVLVVEFDDNGHITSQCLLSAIDGVFGTEIAPRTWHTIISLAPGSVVFEAKDGPYMPINDKNFAPWAPREGEPGTEQFINDVIKRCGIRI